MKDVFIYQIELYGQVNEIDINAMSPLQMTAEAAVLVNRADVDSTMFTISADQSGLIGLMRHLHGLGFVLLAVNRQE